MKRSSRIMLFWTINVARLLLAGTFLVSGFVKAVDPMGMLYKLNAYFTHWGMPLAENSLWLRLMVVVLATMEFVLGIYWLLGTRLRFTTWCTTLLLTGWTCLTAYIYLYNPVADCGCFGEAIVMSNGATLAKNVVLLSLSLLCLNQRRYMKRLISERNQWITSIYTWVYIIVLCLYSYHYLPVLDFTDYKVGTNWRAAWYCDFGEDAPEVISTLYFTDRQTEEDRTEEVLADGYVFLLTIPDPNTADDGNADRINDLYDDCVDRGYAFLCAIGEPCHPEDVEGWTDRTGAAYPLLMADAVQLKAMARSNPGLLLLKDGVLIGKWSHNDLPVLSENDKWQEAAENGGVRSTALGRLLLWFLLPLALIILADRLWIGSKFYRHYIYQKRFKQQKNNEKENCSR